MNVKHSVKSRCDPPLMFVYCAWKSEITFSHTIQLLHREEIHNLELTFIAQNIYITFFKACGSGFNFVLNYFVRLKK